MRSSGSFRWLGRQLVQLAVLWCWELSTDERTDYRPVGNDRPAHGQAAGWHDGGMDIIDFLEARIAEDETEARRGLEQLGTAAATADLRAFVVGDDLPFRLTLGESSRRLHARTISARHAITR